ncbi:MetQ/NlpA family ABC transporter substrate-binding protein [Campylobacter sp. MG1]|uniref:MetQ/NlpA family ABC transporter substrate-binding protein n=1 Tax=Campylobacter sp. MG1 TaxID=2976332 RepID=UPI00226CB785|nr:MetQ/NlpA family ABC transporter substrate-binding protein [Campylobacter sp. MG1]
MKKLIFFTILSLFLNAETIKVGITPYPNAVIMENVKDDLKQLGYDLEVIEFNDYILPNLALNDGELDANMYQHKPFLEDFNESKNTDLVAVANVFLPPMAAYSKKVKDVKDLKDGALIYIPNDPTNESRALDVLEQAGLIKTNKNVKFRSVLDITENPKKLDIKELEAAQVPRTLEECDLAVINTNYALAANLNPIKDSIILEDLNSPYVNVIAVKKGKEEDKKTKALIEVIKTPKIKKILEEQFKGAIIPAF